MSTVAPNGSGDTIPLANGTKSLLFPPPMLLDAEVIDPTRLLRRVAAIANASTLKQDIIFRFDWFEVGLFAEHNLHLDLDAPRDR